MLGTPALKLFERQPFAHVIAGPSLPPEHAQGLDSDPRASGAHTDGGLPIEVGEEAEEAYWKLRERVPSGGGLCQDGVGRCENGPSFTRSHLQRWQYAGFCLAMPGESAKNQTQSEDAQQEWM